MMMVNLCVVFGCNTDLVGCIKKVDKIVCMDAYCNDKRMKIVRMLTLVSISSLPLNFLEYITIGKRRAYYKH
jgi:hypothetical protein